MQGHHHWLKSPSHPETEAGICRQSCCSLQPVSVLERPPALNSLSSYCSFYLPTTQLLMLQLFKGINKANKRKYLCLQIFPQNLFAIPLKFKRSEQVRNTQEDSRAAIKPHFQKGMTLGPSLLAKKKTPTGVIRGRSQVNDGRAR